MMKKIFPDILLANKMINLFPKETVIVLDLSNL